MKRFQWIVVLFAALLVLFVAGCGDDSDDKDKNGHPGDPDGTCYVCSSVCEGATGDVLDECMQKCDYCQEYSDCFAWMEHRYEGADKPMSEWTPIECDKVKKEEE